MPSCNKFREKSASFFQNITSSNKNLSNRGFNEDSSTKSSFNVDPYFQARKDSIEELRPERSLYRAVILQAIVDASSNSSRTEDVVAKNTAMRWINAKDKNFIKVCQLADMEPEFVYKKVHNALKNKKIIDDAKNNQKERNSINKKPKKNNVKKIISSIDFL